MEPTMNIPTDILVTASWLLVAPLVATGAALWTLGEYVLHRFAMHEAAGRGTLSREHLEHHVAAAWTFDPIILLAWLGVVLVAVLGWGPFGWFLGGPIAGASIALGWTAAYGHYEYQHAMSHLRGPENRYQRTVRRHHFHHHFGHPMANHGVTTRFWDRVFGTLEHPDLVRVPRRLAPVWLVDETGAIRPEHAGDYVLVGAARGDERLVAIDRARAFASAAPLA
jgi:sterol desaturase/sphingolipid hydroxylase (fatty acid hydroxylase superfamily)